ncbi:hypothetical protein KKG24_02520 [Patescibacteria group bacterium]|nr:hypothetical protein [Patescibacteria group bacterium]
MEKHLKSHQEYIDEYDKLTVYRCRQMEELHKNTKLDPMVKQNGEDIDLSPMIDAFKEIRMFYLTGQCYENKNKTIREWEEKDKARDDLYESAKEPENISCLTCGHLMFMTSKTFDLGFDKKQNRVMFFYDCPLKHMPRRVFYNTGEEYIIKPHVCSKCHSTVTEDHKKTDAGISITRTCTKCSHVETEDMDFSVKKEEKIDPDFPKDRARFCLSIEEGEKFIDDKIRQEGMGKLVNEWKEKDKNKELYDKIAQLKKLTVLQFEELLVPLLEKNKYLKFHMKDPEAGRDVFVPFIVYDSDDKRDERSSILAIQKLMKKTLESTNWRLMSEGVHYRLGMLNGRLRAYEKEEDLLKLVK